MKIQWCEIHLITWESNLAVPAQRNLKWVPFPDSTQWNVQLVFQNKILTEGIHGPIEYNHIVTTDLVNFSLTESTLWLFCRSVCTLIQSFVWVLLISTFLLYFVLKSLVHNIEHKNGSSTSGVWGHLGHKQIIFSSTDSPACNYLHTRALTNHYPWNPEGIIWEIMHFVLSNLGPPCHNLTQIVFQFAPTQLS